MNRCGSEITYYLHNEQLISSATVFLHDYRGAIFNIVPSQQYLHTSVYSAPILMVQLLLLRKKRHCASVLISDRSHTHYELMIFNFMETPSEAKLFTRKCVLTLIVPRYSNLSFKRTNFKNIFQDSQNHNRYE